MGRSESQESERPSDAPQTDSQPEESAPPPEEPQAADEHTEKSTPAQPEVSAPAAGESQAGDESTQNDEAQVSEATQELDDNPEAGDGRHPDTDQEEAAPPPTEPIEGPTQATAHNPDIIENEQPQADSSDTPTEADTRETDSLASDDATLSDTQPAHDKDNPEEQAPEPPTDTTQPGAPYQTPVAENSSVRGPFEGEQGQDHDTNLTSDATNLADVNVYGKASDEFAPPLEDPRAGGEPPQEAELQLGEPPLAQGDNPDDRGDEPNDADLDDQEEAAPPPTEPIDGPPKATTHNPDTTENDLLPPDEGGTPIDDAVPETAAPSGDAAHTDAEPTRETDNPEEQAPEPEQLQTATTQPEAPDRPLSAGSPSTRGSNEREPGQEPDINLTGDATDLADAQSEADTETSPDETVASDEYNNGNTPSETHPTTEDAATGNDGRVADHTDYADRASATGAQDTEDVPRDAVEGDAVSDFFTSHPVAGRDAKALNEVDTPVTSGEPPTEQSTTASEADPATAPPEETPTNENASTAEELTPAGQDHPAEPATASGGDTVAVEPNAEDPAVQVASPEGERTATDESATAKPDLYNPLSTTETPLDDTAAPDELNDADTPSDPHPTTENAATTEPEQTAPTEPTDQTCVAAGEDDTPVTGGESPTGRLTTAPDSEPARVAHGETSADENAGAEELVPAGQDPPAELAAASDGDAVTAESNAADSVVVSPQGERPATDESATTEPDVYDRSSDAPDDDQKSADQVSTPAGIDTSDTIPRPGDPGTKPIRETAGPVEHAPEPAQPHADTVENENPDQVSTVNEGETGTPSDTDDHPTTPTESEPGSAEDVDRSPQKDADRYRPCFLAGTLVELADGPSPIESVAVGDQVLTTAAESVSVFGHHSVTRVHRGMTRSALDLEFGGGTVRCTSGHLFLVPAAGWRQAGKLRVGDSVVEAGGTSVRLTGRREVRFPADTVTYDLTVDTVSTYFVLAGNRRVLVHNRDEAPDKYDRTLYWFWGRKPNLRDDEDTDGKSAWKTTSWDEVKTLFDYRVNHDHRKLNDPHGYFTEEDLDEAGISHPQTPSGDSLAKELSHHSLRPFGAAEIPPGLTEAQVRRDYRLTRAQMDQLRTKLESESIPTELVRPKELHCG